ncbi:MAG: hypothetical protein SX243_04055 [Acidobacteriota bacterium]|nr:hypothetical protein [Acidobacteriota bacterium]
MGDKLCPKILLEGTRLTGKTELAFALNEHPRIVGARRYRYHSPIVSAEWCGFTDTPWGRGLINFAPEEEALALETYETWVRLFEQLRYYSWIVDRFHLSTRLYQRRSRGKDYDFHRLEERLHAVGFRLIYCHRRPETFAAAREERLKISGNPSQYDDLQPFLEEQEEMAELVAQSLLPTFHLDISDLSPTAAADRIAEWLAATGGLHAPWGLEA